MGIQSNAMAVSEGAAAEEGDCAASYSIYQALLDQHPAVAPQRLRKSTLLALSWAIEDEISVDSRGALLFGAFQRRRYYAPAERRWRELAGSARATYAFADFPGAAPATAETGPVVHVSLSSSAPLHREWAVVCDSPTLPIALTAREVPRQTARRERDRVFESVWTLNPAAVRTAARVCAAVADQHGVAAARPLLGELSSAPTARVDPAVSESVFNRVLAYVDWFRTV